ncbi:MAG: hypothetical protein AB1414_06400 [bacterium]
MEIISIMLFVLSIGLIFISCFFFNNAIEWLGKTFELAEGTIGNIISITGKCLPQIIIPLTAFIFLRGTETIPIGIGAIIGAPLILSTLAIGIFGLTIILLAKKGERDSEIDADELIISRDLKFFLITYSFAIFAGLLEDKFPQIFIGFILLIIYGYYLYRSIAYEERAFEELYTPLYFSGGRGETTSATIISQLVISLISLIGGSYLFVHTMKEITLGIQSPLLGLILAIIFAPLVIEIPSKINIIIWLKDNKDTLALSNIMSSMIFQSTILVMLGILFSPWQLQGIALLAGGIPIVVSTLIFIMMSIQEKINPYVLLGAGGFYLIFLAGLFFMK